MPTLKPCERCATPAFPLRRGYCHACDMRRRQLFGYECSYVDAGPARAHATALQNQGIGLRRIAELSGVSRSAVQTMLIGKTRNGVRQPPSTRCSKVTAERILSVPLPEPTALKTTVSPGARVPIIGTVRRVRALIRFGYTQTMLAEHLGWTIGNFNHALVHPRNDFVLADTALKVEKMFAELELIPGPSEFAVAYAKKRRWLLPMAWDEDTIDDPHAKHVVAVGRPKNVERQGGFAVAYLEMRDLGMGDVEIASRMGLDWDSFLTSKRRNRAEIDYEISLEGLEGETA